MRKKNIKDITTIEPEDTTSITTIEPEDTTSITTIEPEDTQSIADKIKEQPPIHKDIFVIGYI